MDKIFFVLVYIMEFGGLVSHLDKSHLDRLIKLCLNQSADEHKIKEKRIKNFIAKHIHYLSDHDKSRFKTLWYENTDEPYPLDDLTHGGGIGRTILTAVGLALIIFVGYITYVSYRFQRNYDDNYNPKGRKKAPLYTQELIHVYNTRYTDTVKIFRKNYNEFLSKFYYNEFYKVSEVDYKYMRDLSVKYYTVTNATLADNSHLFTKKVVYTAFLITRSLSTNSEFNLALVWTEFIDLYNVCISLAIIVTADGYVKNVNKVTETKEEAPVVAALIMLSTKLFEIIDDTNNVTNIKVVSKAICDNKSVPDLVKTQLGMLIMNFNNLLQYKTPISLSEGIIKLIINEFNAGLQIKIAD